MERVNPVYPYLLEKMLGNIPDAYRVYPSPSLKEVIKKRKLLLLTSPPWFHWDQEVGQIRKFDKQCEDRPFAPEEATLPGCTGKGKIRTCA